MKNSILKLSMISLMTALCYVAFTFLQIKIPTPVGYTSFHLGNTFCVLAALLLGGLPGGIAGAIGMGIGDILDPVYITIAPKTIILKLGIGLVTGYFAHHVFKINQKRNQELKKAVFKSALCGMLFNCIGEPLFSYIYYLIILQNVQNAITYLAFAKFITTFINAILAVILATFIYLVLNKRLKKSDLLVKIAPKDDPYNN